MILATMNILVMRLIIIVDAIVVMMTEIGSLATIKGQLTRQKEI